MARVHSRQWTLFETYGASVLAQSLRKIFMTCRRRCSVRDSAKSYAPYSAPCINETRVLGCATASATSRAQQLKRKQKKTNGSHKCGGGLNEYHRNPTTSDDMKVLSSTFVLLSITRVFAIYEVTYHSSPLAIQPLTILYRDPSFDPDNTTLFLVSPSGTAIEQPAPVIYDSTGQLVWADTSIGNSNDLNLQTYAGKPVLTMWVGSGNPGAGPEVGHGTAQLYDETYSFVANVSAVNGAGGTDFHEFQIVKPENTSAIVTAYNPIPADLSSIGGPVQGWYLNAMFQEIDIASGDVLFNWTSFDHIPLSESMLTLAESTNGTSADTAFDAVHINSIDKVRSIPRRVSVPEYRPLQDTDGHYLVSGRHTWTLYKVNATDGNVIWRLGGNNSSFANTTADAPFFWQHDARWHSADTVSVFDDGAAVVGQDPPTVILSEPYSSGKMLQLNAQNKTFELVKQFVPSPNVAPSFAEGSVEIYGSQVVVGYGTNPWITVHDLSTQKVLFSAVIGPNSSSLWQGAISNYRAYQTTKSIFVGQPKTSPSIAVDNSTSTVYVSWNGATQVDRYALSTGTTASTVSKTLRTISRAGFETEMSAKGSLGYVQVAALAADGSVLGRTAITTAHSPESALEMATATAMSGNRLAAGRGVSGQGRLLGRTVLFDGVSFGLDSSARSKGQCLEDRSYAWPFGIANTTASSRPFTNHTLPHPKFGDPLNPFRGATFALCEHKSNRRARWTRSRCKVVVGIESAIGFGFELPTTKKRKPATRSMSCMPIRRPSPVQMVECAGEVEIFLSGPNAHPHGHQPCPSASSSTKSTAYHTSRPVPCLATPAPAAARFRASPHTRVHAQNRDRADIRDASAEASALIATGRRSCGPLRLPSAHPKLLGWMLKKAGFDSETTSRGCAVHGGEDGRHLLQRMGWLQGCLPAFAAFSHVDIGSREYWMSFLDQFVHRVMRQPKSY
uniref:ASST-domain-containing protein n=1 Tax=Mycena chlorophos TaxID=658473 RepID=A0ABQ0M3V2_MYCCL|nr:predicted protein [Mycena chlorophos]